MLNPNNPLNARIMQMDPSGQLAQLPVMSVEALITMLGSVPRAPCDGHPGEEDGAANFHVLCAAGPTIMREIVARAAGDKLSPTPLPLLFSPYRLSIPPFVIFPSTPNRSGRLLIPGPTFQLWLKSSITGLISKTSSLCSRRMSPIAWELTAPS